MHVLFVHQNFPAQFGHIAGWLVERLGWQCTFVTQAADATLGGVRRLQYKLRGGANDRTHFASRNLENFTWHSHAVYETLKRHPEIQPDLVVGHSGFGSTCFLADLYDAPIINFFEWFYRSNDSDMDFRPEFPSVEEHVLRARIRNAAMLVDLESCTRGYSPTEYQRRRFPEHYLPKIERLFDGIDTDFWYRHAPPTGKPRWIGDRRIDPGTKIVTYVSRGFESMRGFDIFMRVAKRICDARSDVVFICAGSDRHCYGGDDRFTGGKPFREWVLAQDDYDLSRFIFTGSVPRLELVRLFGLSDLHIYLTVPFVLSWSLFNALACGCTVLGSNTPPVAEMIKHEQNGLLADFHDVDGLAGQALRVLGDPEAHRPLGRAGTELIERAYGMEVIMPRMIRMYEETIAQYRAERAGKDFRAAPTYGGGTKEGVELSPATMESGPCSEMTTEAIAAMDADPDMTEPTTSLRVLPAMNGHAVDGKATPRRLRVLLTMAHYYRPSENGSYGSLRDKRAARLSAVRAAIAGWRQLFSAKQYVPSLARPEERVANQDLQLDLEVVVCTHGDDHLLDELDLPAGSWRCARRGSHPMELGYECQAVLREQLGRYDYYCYQEDDLILHDPLWFQKLAWFRQLAGDECLLQPHRYEISTGQGFRKAYIDGDLPLDKTLPYQDIGDRWQLSFDVLGQGIRFIRPKNPHAGCYFLTARQFEQWSRQPYFLDRERSFYSHLESAATLGIMRTFRVYKPAPDHAGFFEIEHAGSAWTERLGRRNATAKRLAVSPR